MQKLHAKATLLLLAAASLASADYTAFQYASVTARGGNLATAPASTVISRTVVVSEDIVVTQLGFEFQEPRQGPKEVGIFDAETQQMLASTTISDENSLDGLYYYRSITPVRLSAGKTYHVAALIPQGQKFFQFVNAPALGPKLTDGGTYRNASATLACPTTTTTTRSHVANFKYTLFWQVGDVAGLPSQMAPTYRSRYDVPTAAAVNTVAVTSTVTDTNGVPLSNFPVTFEVTGDITEAGHAHTGTVFPWLSVGNPFDEFGRPLTEKVGPGSVGGSLTSTLTVNTNASGVATVNLTAPELAGVYRVRAVATNQANTPNWQSVDVKVEGLMPLPTSPTDSYWPVARADDHPENCYVTQELADKLELAATLYMQYQRDDALGLPALVKAMADSGYEGVYKISAVRLRYGNGSLPWGGLYDLLGNLKPAGGHTLHRDGKDIDVFTQPFLQSLPTFDVTERKLKLEHVKNDETATPEQQAIIAQANLLRMKLLVRALRNAGFVTVRNFEGTDGPQHKIHCSLN